MLRVAYAAPLQPYSNYEYDYVAGVFAGSKFTYQASGAGYSSYEIDYNNANALAAEKFFFTQTYSNYGDEEEDFDATGKLARVLFSNFNSASPYSALEEDFTGGVFSGEKVTYASLSGANFASEEVDVSSSGQLESVVYSAMKGTPYSSLEVDYVDAAVSEVRYGFTGVSGASYYAYQVVDDGGGKALMEILDLNSGGHSQIALASGQTLSSLGNDKMTGDGATTFVLNPIYGADTLTNLAYGDTVSLSTSEFADFNALFAASQNSGANVLITAQDGDTLTLKGMNKTTLANLSGEFVFHA